MLATFFPFRKLLAGLDGAVSHRAPVEPPWRRHDIDHEPGRRSSGRHLFQTLGRPDVKPPKNRQLAFIGAF